MEPLSVDLAEFYPLDNAKNNRTEEYDLVRNSEFPSPVFRRGEEFYFAVRFNRDFDEENDIVRVCFSFGPQPNYLKGTKVILTLLSRETQFLKGSKRWGLLLSRNTGDTLTMQVHISSITQVGAWRCSILTTTMENKELRNNYMCPAEIYVLFNPWCKDDPVYMENEEDLDEYIKNEVGKVWMGTYRSPKGKPWVFGQFYDVVLPAALILLDKSGLPFMDRGSPVLVARAISAVVNANDEDGLIVGSWTGQYEDGTSPFAWTGSVGIMEQFFNSGGQPVRYGQCWVFAAATVTVCRVLGIPCRCVTNYVSAHDTNRSLTIDRFFDKHGNRIQNESDDMCWNFHVWNEVWMARPDLPVGYGGWQIIDSTPQEKSDNGFRCGPASIEAVRRGEVGYAYDTPFVFAEVNADICHFQEDEDSDWGFSRLSVDKYHVGRKIITKHPGRTDQEGDSDLWDITSFYKNPEGSESERLAVFNAIKGVPLAQQFHDIFVETNNDVLFNLVDIDVIPLGQGFDVIVDIHNTSAEDRNISAMISASTIYYNGAAAHNIKKAQGTFVVGPEERETMKIHVTPGEFLDKLVDHHLVKIFAIANVQETKQTWSEEDDFMVTKPALNIVTREPAVRVGESCGVSMSFRNPLEVLLTNCTVTIEGPGLQKPTTFGVRDVEPKELITIEQSVVPTSEGEKLLVANFTSNELQGVEGYARIIVEP